MKDYGELVVTAAKMSGDVEAANFAGSLVAIAEQKLSRRLRARQQQRIRTFKTDSNGSIPLPRDFIDLMHVYAGNVRLASVPYEMIKTSRRRGYSLVGDRLYSSEPSTELQVGYFEEIPSLKAEGCNWLLEAAPDIYLQALLHELAVKSLDIERATILLSYLDRLIADFMQHNKSTLITAPAAGGPRP